MLLSLLSSHLAKGTGFRATRGVQSWIWNPLYRRQQLFALFPQSMFVYSGKACNMNFLILSEQMVFWVNGQYRISQENCYDYHGPRNNNNQTAQVVLKCLGCTPSSHSAWTLSMKIGTQEEVRLKRLPRWQVSAWDKARNVSEESV